MLYYITLLAICLLAHISYANPWLPAPGQSIIYSGFNGIDGRSKEKQHQQQEQLSQLKYRLSELQEARRAILYQQTMQDRELHNFEKNYLQTISQEDKAIQEQIEISCALNDYYTSYLQFEHGISDEHALGLKLNYGADKNFLDNNLDNKAIFLLYHKYKFIHQGDYIATLISKFSHSTSPTDHHSNFIDIGIAIGYSNNKLRKKNYYSGNISIRKFLSRQTKKDLGFIFVFNQGKELGKGFFIDNFSEYQYVKGSGSLKNSLIYLQSSVIKNICANNKNICYNIQLGYFWKKSLIYSKNELSGPLISLWLVT